MKRLSFWEIFRNTDFRALNCQTAKCPKSQKKPKIGQEITKLASPNPQKARKNDYYF